MAGRKKKKFISVSEEKALRSNSVDHVKLNLELKLLEKAQAHSIILMNNHINRLKIATNKIETSSGSSVRYLKQRTKDTEEKNRTYFMYGERLENRKFYKRSSLLWDKIDKSAYEDDENDKVEDTGPKYPPLELLLESSSESEDDGESHYTHEYTESGYENIDSGFSDSLLGSSIWSRCSSPSVKSTASHRVKSTPSSARERSLEISQEHLQRPHTVGGVEQPQSPLKVEGKVRRVKSSVVRKASHPKFTWWHGIIEYHNKDVEKEIPERRHLNAFFPHLGTGDEKPEKLPPVSSKASHSKEDEEKKKKKKKKQKRRTWSLRSSVFSPTVASRQREYSAFLVGRSSHSKNKKD